MDGLGDAAHCILLDITAQVNNSLAELMFWLHQYEIFNAIAFACSNWSQPFLFLYQYAILLWEMVPEAIASAGNGMSQLLLSLWSHESDVLLTVGVLGPVLLLADFLYLVLPEIEGDHHLIPNELEDNEESLPVQAGLVLLIGVGLTAAAAAAASNARDVLWASQWLRSYTTERMDLFGMCLGLSWYIQANTKAIAASRDELGVLRSGLIVLRDQLAVANARIEAFQATGHDGDVELVALRSDLTDLTDQLALTNDKLKTLEKRNQLVVANAEKEGLELRARLTLANARMELLEAARKGGDVQLEALRSDLAFLTRQLTLANSKVEREIERVELRNQLALAETEEKALGLSDQLAVANARIGVLEAARKVGDVQLMALRSDLTALTKQKTETIELRNRLAEIKARDLSTRLAVAETEIKALEAARCRCNGNRESGNIGSDTTGDPDVPDPNVDSKFPVNGEGSEPKEEGEDFGEEEKDLGESGKDGKDEGDGKYGKDLEDGKNLEDEKEQKNENDTDDGDDPKDIVVVDVKPSATWLAVRRSATYNDRIQFARNSHAIINPMEDIAGLGELAFLSEADRVEANRRGYPTARDVSMARRHGVFTVGEGPNAGPVVVF